MLGLRRHSWSWPIAANHPTYGGRVTYVTCVESGQVRLCDPQELRILSAREDRRIRNNPQGYLESQQKFDEHHRLRRQKAWQALVNHPKAME